MIYLHGIIIRTFCLSPISFAYLLSSNLTQFIYFWFIPKTPFIIAPSIIRNRNSNCQIRFTTLDLLYVKCACCLEHTTVEQGYLIKL